MTNYEKIKNMSVEEKADFFRKMCNNSDFCAECPLDGDCPLNDGLTVANSNDWEEWLNKEVSEKEQEE